MSVSLRTNRVLEKLRRGEVVSCTKLNLSDPRVVEIAALSGLDCVWLDTEHVPNSVRDIEHSIRAAQAYGIDAVVPVRAGQLLRRSRFRLQHRNQRRQYPRRVPNVNGTH